MTRELLLALDCGTTGVRALVVSAEGKVLGRAYRPLATHYPAPGRVEQDPEEIWSHSVAVLREAVSRSGVGAGALAGVGVATQRATAIAWDATTGEALAPALGWQDARTAPRVAELVAQGIPITTLPSATKFEWLLRHHDAVRDAAASGRLRLGTPDAWLGARLTGGDAHVTDPGQASCTGLLDLASGDWWDAALSLFSLEAAALPRVVASSGVVGETPRDLLGAAIPVAARAGDQQAACFAQGAHEPGDAKLTLGTAAMLDVHTGGTPAPPGAAAFPLGLWRLGGTDAFCLEATVITAGAAVDWLVGLGLLASPDALDAVVDGAGADDGVVFVPALQGLGHPFLDTEARGLLGGLTRGSGRAGIVRAVVDGVAQRCADLCEALAPEPRPLRVDGGLARSDRLLQRVADLAGRPVRRAAETETTALGAALLAGLAVGLLEDPAACRALLAVPDPFEPRIDPADRARARERWAGALRRARLDSKS